jgi:hypothetical protein
MERTKALGGMLACLTLLTACGDDHGPPTGSTVLSMGAVCYGPYQCATNYCCVSPPCGGGMCTYPCQRDADCPYGARCADNACFWACSTDAQCAPGWTCKHGHTVCQR